MMESIKSIFRGMTNCYFHIINISFDEDNEPVCDSIKVYCSKRKKNGIETDLLKKGYMKMLIKYCDEDEVTEAFFYRKEHDGSLDIAEAFKYKEKMEKTDE